MNWKIKEYKQQIKNSDVCRYGRFFENKCTNVGNRNIGLKHILHGKYGFCIESKCLIKVK